MHTEYLQSIRYKLQKHVRRQKSTGYETYAFVLKQLWNFLDSEHVFAICTVCFADIQCAFHLLSRLNVSLRSATAFIIERRAVVKSPIASSRMSVFLHPLQIKGYASLASLYVTGL